MFVQNRWNCHYSCRGIHDVESTKLNFYKHLINNVAMLGVDISYLILYFRSIFYNSYFHVTSYYFLPICWG